MPRMSAYRGRPEVVGTGAKRRFLPEPDIELAGRLQFLSRGPQLQSDRLERLPGEIGL